MTSLFRNAGFKFGFWTVIFIFFILNIAPSRETNEFSGIVMSVIIIDRGFPFLAFREGISSNYSTYVFWSGVMGNIVTALFCGSLVGLVGKYIWSKTFFLRVD